MKTLLFGFVCSLSLSAGVLPQMVGAYQKGVSKAIPVESRPVWDEYGLQETEEATYQKSGALLKVRAFRLQDATAALAAFQWQRPKDAKPANEELRDLSPLSVETPTSVMLALGNYLLMFEGYKPTPEEIANVIRSMPRQQGGPLPTLPSYLPSTGLEPGSERYVIGPASLAAFVPEISPSEAGFHLGTEVQAASYKTAGGSQKLAILSFPMPELARKRIVELEKIPGIVAKRSGPFVAVVFSPTDINAAETLLAQIRYQASITTNQPAPSKKDNPGNFFLNVFTLVAILVVFALVSGLVFGGFRQLMRRGKNSADGDAMITLHLEDQ